MSCGNCSGAPRSIEITANDIVYDAARDLVYASVDGSYGVTGNSIAAIQPSTASVLWTVFVGSTPKPIALSVDGSKLWVGLDGSRSVRVLDLTTRTVGPEITFTVPPSTAPLRASSFAPVADGGTVVAFNDTYNDVRALAIYDDTTMRGMPLRPSLSGMTLMAIDSSTVAGFVYSYNDSILKIPVTPTGLGTTMSSPLTTQSTSEVSFDGGYIITPAGNVIDPVAARTVGQCAFLRYGAQRTVGDAKRNRIYAALVPYSYNDPTFDLVACDRTTFTQTAKVPLSNIKGDVKKILLRPGIGLILLVTANVYYDVPRRVIFVDTNLVAAN